MIISRFESSMLDLGYIDELSQGNSSLHAIDGRVKVFVAFIFILSVVSIDKYNISELMPFFIYPAYILSIASVPFLYLIKRLISVSPFVLFIALFNPFFDGGHVFYLFGLSLGGGWISMFSIIIKFILTVSTALLLIASTGFYNICFAMRQFGIPSVFTVQLLFLYRYIFLLIREGAGLVRAARLRSYGKSSFSLKLYGVLTGNLLIRSIDRSRGIHRAMVSRGYNGEIPHGRTSKIMVSDIVFLIIWTSLFMLFRFVNISELIGNYLTGIINV